MRNKPHRPDTLRGLIVLAALVVSLLLLFYLLNRRDGAGPRRMAERAHAAFVRDSLDKAAAEREEQRKLREEKKKEWKKKHEEYERQKAERARRRAAEDSVTVFLHPFDPNTADSAELRTLGLRPWMARSVCRYRESGGRFRNAAAFRKVYGMTDSLFTVLEPYIVITIDTAAADSLTPHYVPLRKCDTILQLNLTDTAELQLIRGIGRYTAVQIIRYRERLGGYVSPGQIREIPHLRAVDSLLPHLSTDSLHIKPLYINRRNVERLAQHPYLSFEQAKGIYTWRHKHGPVHNIDELLKIKDGKEPLFNESDLSRLAPYLCFEE